MEVSGGSAIYLDSFGGFDGDPLGDDQGGEPAQQLRESAAQLCSVVVRQRVPRGASGGFAEATRFGVRGLNQARFLAVLLGFQFSFSESRYLQRESSWSRSLPL